MNTPIPGVHDVIRVDDPLTVDVDPVIAHAQRILNKSLFGRVEIEYDTRRITVTNIAGDVALRLHKLVSDYREGDPSSARWSDQLDPSTADAGDGWFTFDVKRVLALRWFPERLVYGDKDRRKLLAAAVRLVTKRPKLSNPSLLSTEILADCGEILLDMGLYEPQDSVAGVDDDHDDLEPSDEDDDDPETEDEDPAPPGESESDDLSEEG